MEVKMLTGFGFLLSFIFFGVVGGAFFSAHLEAKNRFIRFLALLAGFACIIGLLVVWAVVGSHFKIP